MAKNQISKKNLNKKKKSELNLKRRNPVFLPNKLLMSDVIHLSVFK